MKKIGLIGGLGPLSTIDYYNGLIKIYREDMHVDQYPEIVIDSLNMSEILEYFNKKQYDKIADILCKSINNLKAAGAEIAGICSNTPHIVWDLCKTKFSIPVVSIVESTVAHIQFHGYKKILILGTAFTMKSGLYDKKLRENGITPIQINDEDKEILGNIIFQKLEQGIVDLIDKQNLIALIEKYVKSENCDAVLLGCTELPIIIKSEDVSVPVIDTTNVHIESIYKSCRVATAREVLDPIAVCGFSCNHCFLMTWCGGCRSDYNICSFATICENGICTNVKCCKSRDLYGCYECEDLSTCTKGFYATDNDGGAACKALALFVAKYGKVRFFKIREKLHQQYRDYRKIQQIIGNDVRQALLFLENFL